MSSQPAFWTTLWISIRRMSATPRLAAWRPTGVAALIWVVAVIASPAWGADDAVAARERGAAVIDAFVDHYRRTGDPTSKLAELNAMAPELAAAVRTFVARGDNAGAAQTLIPLGDIHRMQGRWELALTAYRLLGCRDVARIDFRLDAAGAPHFIECNPLPGLDPDNSDLVILSARRRTYGALVQGILLDATARMSVRIG